MEEKTKAFRIKRPVRFRTGLMAFFTLAVIVVAAVCVCGYISFYYIMSDATAMFNRSYDLTLTYTKLNDVQRDIEGYTSTTSSDSLMMFYSDRDMLLEYAENLEKSSSYTDKGIKLKNISNMLENYLVVAENTINAKRGRNVEVYTSALESAKKESTIITGYIKNVINDEVLENVGDYSTLNENAQQATIFNGVLAAAVIVIIIVMIVIFSFEVTRPITELSEYSKKISDGNFNIEIPEPPESTEEMNLLYSAFSKMAKSINEYVKNLTEKAELEKKLNQEKVTNLRMKSTLHEIELKALQSQINPHFIFNTINIGAKMALLADDNETCHYLENAADVFRYNLRGLDMKATLRDELENISAYIFLLQTRFGKDSFEFECPDFNNSRFSAWEIPRLTLQPLIENAYIHGISNMESGGRISISVNDMGKYVFVKISDNGTVIDEEHIRRLLLGESMHSKESRGHTTGIGVNNVLERLRLFFGRDDVMDIVSTEEETSFIIKMPKRAEEQNV